METLPETRRDARTWTVLCHASALVGFFVPAVGHIIGPLVIWLLKRDQFPEVDEHGKESINFQLSMLIYAVALGIICGLLIFVLVGFLLLPLFGLIHLLDVVLVIVASIQANDGKLYRYPMTIRLIK